jgi:hypothetical protein
MKKPAIEHEQICWGEWELQPREPTFRAIPLGINYAEKIFYHLLARIIHESQTRPWDSLHEVL